MNYFDSFINFEQQNSTSSTDTTSTSTFSSNNDNNSFRIEDSSDLNMIDMDFNFDFGYIFKDSDFSDEEDNSNPQQHSQQNINIANNNFFLSDFNQTNNFKNDHIWANSTEPPMPIYQNDNLHAIQGYDPNLRISLNDTIETITGMFSNNDRAVRQRQDISNNNYRPLRALATSTTSPSSSPVPTSSRSYYSMNYYNLRYAPQSKTVSSTSSSPDDDYIATVSNSRNSDIFDNEKIYQVNVKVKSSAHVSFIVGKQGSFLCFVTVCRSNIN